MSTRTDSEINLGALGRALAARWWLILILVLIGAGLAVVIAHARDDTYTATASVYLGQATDVNGNPVASLNANPRAAAYVAQTEEILAAAAQHVGAAMTAAKLRRALRVEIPPQPARTSGVPNNLVSIHISSGDPRVAAKAANAVARQLADRLAAPSEQKSALLREDIAAGTAQLTTIDARMESAESALSHIAAGPGTAAEKAALSAPYFMVLQSAATLRETVATDLRAARRELLVVRAVERPYVASTAAPPARAASSGWGIVAVTGALAGAIVGVVAALCWRRRTAAP